MLEGRDFADEHSIVFGDVGWQIGHRTPTTSASDANPAALN